MNTFTKAYIPYNGYYSTPFTRWQGSMQNENSIELAGKTARRWFLEKKKIDPAILDYLYFGISIYNRHMFYSHNWAAGYIDRQQEELAGSHDQPGMHNIHHDSQSCSTCRRTRCF